MNPVVAILKKAREMVAKGWLQNGGMSSDGKQVCAVMSINLAFSELVDANEIQPTLDKSGHRTPQLANDAGDVLMKAIDDRFPNSVGWHSIPFWNDTPGRTQEEVVDTFDHAIKTVEAESV